MSFMHIRASSPNRIIPPDAPIRSLSWYRRLLRYVASIPEGWWYGLILWRRNRHARSYFASIQIEGALCEECGRYTPVALMRVVSLSNGNDALACHLCVNFQRLAKTMTSYGDWE